jgi:hypothetical protein
VALQSSKPWMAMVFAGILFSLLSFECGFQALSGRSKEEDNQITL